MEEEVVELVNPDAGAKETKFNWDEDFQSMILSMLITDRQFLLQSMDLIKPSYFTQNKYSAICSIVFEHFQKYRIIPNRIIIGEELKKRAPKNKLLEFKSGLEEVESFFKEGVDEREYLLKKILYFAKTQALKEAFTNSLELIDKRPDSDETWQKVGEKMYKALQLEINVEMGLDYFKSVRDRYVEQSDADVIKDTFTSTIRSVDEQLEGFGFARGEMFSVVAASGVGKSVFLACMAAQNVRRGHKVLYVTLELKESKVATRLDAIVTGYPIRSLKHCKEELFTQLEQINSIDPDADEMSPLLIKQFPAGTATVNTIRAYLTQLGYYGYKPDMLIIDYVGEMALHPGMEEHASREHTVRELRGLAMELDIFVATAMQPNREGKRGSKEDGGRIDDDHLAGSFGQIKPLDGCISLMQNDEEKGIFMGRGYVIKLRDGKSRFDFFLRFDPENLRIQEVLKDEYMAAKNRQNKIVADQVMVDNIKPLEKSK